MKIAIIAILALIFTCLVLLLVAALGLSAARRARLRGDAKGREYDYSGSETVQFTGDDLEEPPPPRDPPDSPEE